MMSWMKYALLCALFVVGALLVAALGTANEANITGTQEVMPITQSAKLGVARESADNLLDKKAIGTNIVLEAVKSYKEQGLQGDAHDMEVSYVFLDKNGNKTMSDNNIAMVQFKVDVIDNKKPDRIITTSTQRISINKQ